MSLILTVIIFYSPRISLTLSLFFWALLACIQISYAISLCTVCNVRVCSLHSLVEYQGNCRKRVMTLLPLVTRDPDLFSFKFEQGSGKLLSLQSASFQISQQATRSFESVRFEHGLLSLLWAAYKQFEYFGSTYRRYARFLMQVLWAGKKEVGKINLTCNPNIWLLFKCQVDRYLVNETTYDDALDSNCSKGAVRFANKQSKINCFCSISTRKLSLKGV